MKKKKFKFSQTLDNDFALKIYAIILAVLIWFIMSITLYPTISKNISDIPLTLEIEGTSAEENSLEAVDFDENQTISIRIEGMRYEIGNISSEDINANLIVTGVNEPGNYPLKINIEAKNGEEFDTISIFPETIDVKFDNFTEEEFTLIPEAPNITVEPGYMLKSTECSQDTIKISGPKQEVDRITKVVVHTENEQILTESTIIDDTEIILYSGNSILQSDSFTFDPEDVDIEVSVLKTKTVPFEVEFSNVPRNFDITSLNYSFSPSLIDIAGPKDSIDNTSEINLGYFNFRKIDLDTAKNFTIPLDSSFINSSGYESVDLKFNTEGYSSKNITLDKSQIHIINEPINYTYNIQTDVISNIKIIGPEDVIDNISSSDIVAELNILESDITTSTYSLPVSIYSPEYNNVWAYGEYEISINFTEKPNVED